MKRLRNFLRSPYHNRSQLLIDLFEYYYRRYPDFAGVDDETLFRKAIPDRVFDPVYLNNRLSDLDKLVEQFLMVEEIKERPLAVWRAVLQKRGCMDLYAKEVFSELDRVDREPTLSWRTLHSRWLLHQELFSSKVDLPVEQANLVVAGLFEHADEHFLLARLSYACEMRSRGTAPEDPLFELVLEKANQRAGEQPLVRSLPSPV